MGIYSIRDRASGHLLLGASVLCLMRHGPLEQQTLVDLASGCQRNMIHSENQRWHAIISQALLATFSRDFNVCDGGIDEGHQMATVELEGDRALTVRRRLQCR